MSRRGQPGDDTQANVDHEAARDREPSEQVVQAVTEQDKVGKRTAGALGVAAVTVVIVESLLEREEEREARRDPHEDPDVA